MNKKIIIAISVLVIAILFVGTIFYYNSEIANLNSQISNLKGQIQNLTSANLTTALSITEIPYIQFPFGGPPPDNLPTPPNNLYINGSVSNMGGGIAFNAGLHVVAYAANGTLEVNMTVPLVNGATVFGTDDATDAFVSNYYKDYAGSLELGYLKSGQTVTFDLSFYHEGTASNWTATPVWTNSP
jgi:hypothetical protein